MLSDWIWLWRSIDKYYQKREQAELEHKQHEEALRRFDEAMQAEKERKQAEKERREAQQKREQEARCAEVYKPERYPICGGAIDVAMQARKDRLKRNGYGGPHEPDSF
jgi:hypothetical protein